MNPSSAIAESAAATGSVARRSPFEPELRVSGSNVSESASSSKLADNLKLKTWNVKRETWDLQSLQFPSHLLQT